jgi:hypothetical protein
MRIYPTINMWIEGDMKLSLYQSASEHDVIGCNITDEHTTIMGPCFFVANEHKAKLSAAIEAFNTVWESTNGTKN